MSIKWTDEEWLITKEIATKVDPPNERGMYDSSTSHIKWSSYLNLPDPRGGSDKWHTLCGIEIPEHYDPNWFVDWHTLGYCDCAECQRIWREGHGK